MVTFLIATLGFLFARVLWHAVRHYAKICGELPLVWFVKTLLIVGALCGIVAAMGFGLVWAFAETMGR